MKISFEHYTNLQYENRALQKRIKAFESAEAYVCLREDYERRLKGKDREIQQLKSELEMARRQIVSNRENWFQTYEDLEKEHRKESGKKDREIGKLRRELRETAASRDMWREKYREQLHLRCVAETALEEEKGKNQQLRAQLSRDYENSSIPSSKAIRHKKIANSREKSGKRPGGGSPTIRDTAGSGRYRQRRRPCWSHRRKS